MRIITRYILREVTSHALLGGVLFTFVLFMRDLGRILELVVRDSASMADVARIFLFTLPNALTLTIPMAVLVGILLGLSRLAADSEITAMRAAGMGALDFVRIVSIVSIVALGLGLLNSLYLAPYSASALLTLEDSLKSSQASFEVEPRVFYEDFKNYVLYVQDIRPASGAALWHHVFLANLTQPGPNITTADEAVVVNETTPTTATDANPQSSPTTPPQSTSSIRLHLLNGGQHQMSDTDPSQYNISTFVTSDIPIQTGAQEDTHLGRADTPILSLSLSELIRRGEHSSAPDARIYRIEFNKRFSYPFACLVLMLVGVPLGISSKRGGKSTGFVLTILLVFVYYVLSLVGIAFAKSGKLDPFIGVWGANLIFAAAGALLLFQMSRGGIALSLVGRIGQGLNKLYSRFAAKGTTLGSNLRPPDIATILRRLRGILGTRFPLILDDYVMREYITNLALILAAFSSLFIIFTFFELIGDIIRNRTPLVTVGDYLLNLIPYIIYNVTPLCSLVAVLITFGALNRSSELTAMKATGISLYRVVAPVLVIALLISCALFAFDDLYLPAANRRQDALRSIIKGKPAQTFLRPDRQWMSGQATPPPTAEANSTDPSAHPAATPARIFYYQFFDPYKNVFANLTVFEFDPNLLRPHPTHLRDLRPLGRPRLSLGLRKRLAAHLLRRDGLVLSTLHHLHLPRDPRATQLLHQGGSPGPGDELRRALPLHHRPQTIGLRHQTPRRPALQEDRRSTHLPRHGHPRRPVRPLHGQARRPRWNRHRHRPRHLLLGHRRHLQRHGQRQHPPCLPRRLDAGPPLRHRRSLSPFTLADLNPHLYSPIPANSS